MRATYARGARADVVAALSKMSEHTRSTAHLAGMRCRTAGCAQRRRDHRPRACYASRAGRRHVGTSRQRKHHGAGEQRTLVRRRSGARPKDAAALLAQHRQRRRRRAARSPDAHDARGATGVAHQRQRNRQHARRQTRESRTHRAPIDGGGGDAVFMFAFYRAARPSGRSCPSSKRSWRDTRGPSPNTTRRRTLSPCRRRRSQGTDRMGRDGETHDKPTLEFYAAEASAYGARSTESASRNRSPRSWPNCRKAQPCSILAAAPAATRARS